MSTHTVHPSAPPVTATVAVVDPSTAQRWLQANKVNRNPRTAKVEQYARDMAAGNWRLTGEAVQFDRDGNLIDGQHRLSAVVLSGATVRLFVVNGLDAETQAVLDSGAARSAGDALGFAGYENTAALAAAARLALNYEAGLFRHAEQDAHQSRSHSELLDFIEANPGLVEAASKATALSSRIPANPSVIGFTYWATSRVSPTEAAQFFADLADMRTNGVGDPRHTLIRRLNTARQRNERVTSITQSFYVFRSWNALRAGKQLGNLKTGNAHGPFAFVGPK